MSTTRTRFLVAAAALLAASCSREVPEASKDAVAEEVSMQRVKLPGFSIDAPKGEVIEHSTSPTSGKYQVNLPRASLADHLLHDAVRDSQFMAIWSNEVTSRDSWEKDYLPMVLRGLETAVPGSKVLYRESLDETRWFSIVGRDRVPVAVGVVVCDPRFQVEVTFSRSHELKPQSEFMRRTLQSVRCEVSEENRASMTPAIHLPEDFGSVPVESGFQFLSLGGEVLGANFTAGRMPDDASIYDAAIYSALSTMDPQVRKSAVTAVAPTHSRRDPSERMSRARLPSRGQVAYVGSLYCAREGVTLMFLSFSAKPDDSLAWRRFAQMECPTGAPLSIPTYVSLLESACTRGDAAACEIRKGLVSGDPGSKAVE